MKKKSQKINDLKKITISKLKKGKIIGGVALAGGRMECVQTSRVFIFVKDQQ